MGGHIRIESEGIDRGSLDGLMSFSQISNLTNNERTDDKYYKMMQLDDTEMPPQKGQDMQNTVGIGGDSVGMSTENPSGGLAVHHQYYPGASHGYLSSLAGLQSLNQSQPFNVGGGHDPASNMSLLQGFNLSAPLVATQPQQRQQFYQMGGGRSNNLVDQAGPYPSENDQWPPQSFVNRPSLNASSSAVAASDSALWAMGNNPITTSSSSGGSTSLNPNQLPDLPGSYGSPN